MDGSARLGDVAVTSPASGLFIAPTLPQRLRPIRIRPEDEVRHVALDICPQVRRSPRGNNHIARNDVPARAALNPRAGEVAAGPRGRTTVGNGAASDQI